MSEIISSIRRELMHRGEEKNRIAGRRYFKEEIELYGVATAEVTTIGKAHYKTIRDAAKKVIFGLCEELWESGYMEESFIACNWSYYIRKEYAPGDFKVFERWVKKYVRNWAACDTLCNHTIGAFIETYPACASKVRQWARSKNRWMRRASAVTFIIPARKGLFLTEILGIADTLLTDRDDLVQKGYGWMLKAASEAHRDEVFDFLMKRKAAMPRTALRYAIEKMPKELRMRAMEKGPR